MKKIYKVTLKTLGPIFIGSGQTLRKSMYLHKNQQVSIIDETKFIQILDKVGKYDLFLEGMEKNPHLNLRDFLDKNKITSTSFVKYTLPVNSFKGTARRLNDLSLFVRDGNGDAYIPGSSLKGALRTCILEKIKDDNANNEIFKNLSVSDSSIIDNNSFEVYQKVDYTSPKKTPNSLSLYRECIKPDVEICFTLSLGDCITIEQIQEGIRKTYSHYHYNWAGNIKEPQIHPENDKGRCLLYLGGGAGFVSKTLHYKEKPKAQAKKDAYEILRRKFPVYKKITNPKNVPMALKITTSSMGDLEMGLCELSFEEMEMQLW